MFPMVLADAGIFRLCHIFFRKALDGANDPDLAEGHAAQQEGDEARVTIGGVTTYYTEFAGAFHRRAHGSRRLSA